MTPAAFRSGAAHVYDAARSVFAGSSPPHLIEIPLLARFQALPGNVRGAIWLLLSGVCFSAMGVLIKTASADMHAFEIAFFRAFLGFVVILPFALRHGFRPLKTRRPMLHLVRGLLGGVVMTASFYSVAHMPLADATAISFSKPLFLIPLAVIFLGEVVRLRRTIATLVGFIGVVIMLRPGGDVDPVALIALMAAALVAVLTVMIKILSRTDNPATMIFWSSLILSLCTLGPAILHWQTPTLDQLVLLSALAICGTIGQSFMIRGYNEGETMAVTPFDYCRLLYAGIAGYIFFSEVPDVWTITGAAIIVASTLYIAYREAKLKPGTVPATGGIDMPAQTDARNMLEQTRR
ncbi:MAG: DMT family transporter [Pseudomonadota bacterium]|nr:DMT family transporter [Pseudomonadota bacterium]